MAAQEEIRESAVEQNTLTTSTPHRKLNRSGNRGLAEKKRSRRSQLKGIESRYCGNENSCRTHSEG